MKRFLPALLALLSSACVIAPTESPGQKAGGGTVLLCHKGKTMELPQEAASAHIKHGDRYGPC